MANKAITAIRSLFPDRTINFNCEALKTSVDTHGIYPGYRSAFNGKSCDVGNVGYGWCAGGTVSFKPPYAWHLRKGIYSAMVDSPDGLSLFPYFG
jgi:hypothetical protein